VIQTAAPPSLTSLETRPDGKRVLHYHLHAGQLKALEAKGRIILVLAGSQGGKTTIAPLWTHQEIGRFPKCETLGDGDHIVSAPTYTLLDAKLVPAYRRYFCRDLKWGVFHAAKMMITSRHDQSRIVFRSADNPEALESFTARSAVCDEFGMTSVSVQAWEAVQRRVRTTAGRILITTTPYALGWLYQQVYQRAVGGEEGYDLIRFASSDNPAFPSTEMDRAKRSLPDWKFRMFHLGEFVRPAGLIYVDYEDSYAKQDTNGRVVGGDGHLVRPFTIPPTWLRRVGIDPGGLEHVAMVWLAADPGTGVWFAYREVLGGGKSMAEHARGALEYQEPVSLWSGGSASEGDARRTWQEAGVPMVQPAIPDLEAGIDRVIGLFRQRKLYIFDTLTGLRSELGTYSRELDAAGSPLLRIQNKEQFHRLDALRYVCASIPLKAAPERVMPAWARQGGASGEPVFEDWTQDF